MWRILLCPHGNVSSQELPDDAAELLVMGVGINACSLSQLRRLSKEAAGSSIGVRFNPGLGSGGTKSTNVGGPASSFGKHLATSMHLRVKFRGGVWPKQPRR